MTPKPHWPKITKKAKAGMARHRANLSSNPVEHIRKQIRELCAA